MVEAEKNMGAGGATDKEADVAALYARLRSENQGLRRLKLLVPVVLIVILAVYGTRFYKIGSSFEKAKFVETLQREAQSKIPAIQKALSEAVAENSEAIIAAGRDQAEKRWPEIRAAAQKEIDKVKADFPNYASRTLSGVLEQKFGHDMNDLLSNLPEYSGYLQDDAIKLLMKNTNSQLAEEIAKNILLRIHEHLISCEASVYNIVYTLEEDWVRQEIDNYKNDKELEQNLILKFIEVIDKTVKEHGI
ncbi:MAG: hypothetical protein V1918_06380 [Planctomycetota bacterium]